MFVIFVLYNFFFFFFLQFEQKNSTCLTIMCFLSHKQCAIKTLNTRFSCKNLLNLILFVFNWIMSALCIFERLICMFKWQQLTLEINLRYWISFVFSFYLLFQIFRDEARIKFIRIIILWWKRSNDDKTTLYVLFVILSIISLLLMFTWLKI